MRRNPHRELERLLVVESRVDLRAVGARKVALRRVRARRPMHSVTSSPVSSKCTPPRRLPCSRWMRKAVSSSATMLSKRRVLTPPAVVSVLPCIGSQTQSTGPPARAHRVDQTAAAVPSICPAPMRWISTRRPGSLCGFSTRHRPCSQSRGHRRPDLHADRIGDAAEVLDVRAVERPRCACRSRAGASTGCTSAAGARCSASAPARTSRCSASWLA